ncbi:hypothetical protein C5613_29580 [Rhodococcus opacus]|uniref:Uncharacterized protein n=1 Tax=Rhodococcus opacus TaxID=37919 RepID=A0A2S8IYH8_RHOOP|nr:hypothetical protein C5613_29580 [Rhodococcus opacus]
MYGGKIQRTCEIGDDTQRRRGKVHEVSAEGVAEQVGGQGFVGGDVERAGHPMAEGLHHSVGDVVRVNDGEREGAMEGKYRQCRYPPGSTPRVRTVVGCRVWRCAPGDPGHRGLGFLLGEQT